jgi:hypothetical protein
MDNAPLISFGKNTIAGNLVMHGWEEYRHWAYLNLPAWNEALNRAHYAHTSEVLTLKCLAVRLTEENLELKRQITELAQIPGTLQ